MTRHPKPVTSQRQIDETHFVRTGWLNTPIDCDSAGDNCVQSGIELLEVQGSALVVTSQVRLPQLTGAPLNSEYPVAVAALGGNAFAVITLPGAPAATSHLARINGDGTVTVGGSLPDDVEGLWFDAAGARIVALSYDGVLTTYDASDLSPRGETASFPIGAGFPLPVSLTWDDAAAQFIALSSESGARVALATPDFAAVSDIAYDHARNPSPIAVEYLPDTGVLAIMDNPPPADPNGGGRIPAVNLYALAGTTATFDRTVALTPGASRRCARARWPTRPRRGS